MKFGRVELEQTDMPVVKDVILMDKVEKTQLL